MAACNRHGYDTEKRQALNQWAKKLRQIVGLEEQDQGKIFYLNMT